MMHRYINDDDSFWLMAKELHPWNSAKHPKGFLEPLDVCLVLVCAPLSMPTNLKSQPHEFDGIHRWRRHLIHGGVFYDPKDVFL
jgi:hypothetical protein